MLGHRVFKHLMVSYRKGTADEKVLDHSFDKDIFYPELYDLKAGENLTIIDVGAHIGTFTLLTTQRFNHCKVISIEPNPETFSILKRNINQNNLGNVVLHEAALVDTMKNHVKLFLSSENWEHSITKNFGESYVEVPGITLTEVFEQQNIEHCDLIKLNCEGAEFKILFETPTDILSRIKMMLILFHEDLVDPTHNRDKLKDFLTKNHFWVRETNSRKDRGWIIAKNKRFYNYQGPIKAKLNQFFSLTKARILKNTFPNR